MATTLSTINNQPLISIVMATYNGARFLQEQLDSLFQQTYSNIEIVIVDDCSSDNTIEILKQNIIKNNNLFLYCNEKNLGYQKNFEKGVLLAKGEYIALCDQDDIWYPQKIEVLLKDIGNFSIAYCDSEIIDTNNKEIGIRLSQQRNMKNFISPLMYIYGTASPSHAMLIKQEIIKNAIPFPTLIPHDYWLGFIASLKHGTKFVSQVLVKYREHENNVTIPTINKKDSLHRRATSLLTQAQRKKLKYQKLELFYHKCPKTLPDKLILKEFMESYQNFSLKNNFKRMLLFFKYIDFISSHKKRNKFRKILFCLKTFYKMV